MCLYNIWDLDKWNPDSTNVRLWVDEWMRVMAKRPELATDEKAMTILFRRAIDAGRQAERGYYDD